MESTTVLNELEEAPSLVTVEPMTEDDMVDLGEDQPEDEEDEEDDEDDWDDEDEDEDDDDDDE